ncbi:MAG TPA: glutamate--tRNA ligase, partial [Actinomycetota bacterium]|nr:glutamate--tRNA ligase [Actinomycetota bacterium]
MPEEVRCRFAPAPTGYLHVGGARTALFNFLFARHNGGSFVLRIEDTDRKRSTEEAIDIVIDSLRWLGIEWDEGPGVDGPYGRYRQTERMTLYADVAKRFLDQGRAYFCYCTPAELEDRRAEARKRGETPGYDGRCRRLSEEQRAQYEAEGRAKAIRFAMPEGRDITVHDLIRGDAHFPASDLRDFVIVRSDGTPTYLLASAVDDVEMKMTHVIRGEDLLPSTPRQLEIIGAIGATPPAYAHLPLIVGPNGQPLSKRHGSVAVEWFREEGYVPEALVNYLALLGWSFDASTTFFTLDELIEKFDLSRVSHNPAAFDPDKLKWMNGHYIRETSDDRLADLVTDALQAEGLPADRETVIRAIPLVKERMHTLREGVGYLRFLFVDELEPDEKGSKFVGPDRSDYLREVASRLEALDEWTHG